MSASLATYQIQSYLGSKNMYDKRPDRDWATAAVTAALGAGVVTSFAVSRGQNPLVALAITVFAAGVALICDRFGLI
ncbi:MAG TPA: hypothetical protein DCS91_09190 [Microcoleaceae bacterium UBA11344]|nr:hypothetical protein [Microcoleaceae cyanobacterium UBA11344]